MAWLSAGAIACEETVVGNLSFHIRKSFLPCDAASIASCKLYVQFCRNEKKKGTDVHGACAAVHGVVGAVCDLIHSHSDISLVSVADR